MDEQVKTPQSGKGEVCHSGEDAAPKGGK